MIDTSKEASVLVFSCLSGGSGKTSACLNIATMLSEKGPTLACDFDPQGNLSQWLGWNDLSQEATIAETILSSEDREDIRNILKKPLSVDRGERLILAPADYSLSAAADGLTGQPGRERFLRRALKPVLNLFEFVIIDSPPAKGVLTYNAILAADYIVIPTECTPKGVQGAVATLTLLRELEELEFRVPKLLGIIPTRDQWSGSNQTRVSKAALEALARELPDIHLFKAVRQSTIVQQTNNLGWSLEEADQKQLAEPFAQIVEALIKEVSNVPINT
jgi:chromosome partitioning protein